MAVLDQVVLDGGRVGLAATACVRVRDPAGEVVGSGFLVGSDVVATCAHVVAYALGTSPCDAAPDGLVTVDLPLLPGGAVALLGRVERWLPVDADGHGDVALLRLAGAPAGVVMPALRGADLWDREATTFGFPQGREDGVWATGRLRGEQATGWLQFQATAGDQRIEPGFSGAPVWDAGTGAVVGMMVAADRDDAVTTAYLVPIADVLGLDPALLPCPYRGVEPFGEEHAPFFHGRDAELERLSTAIVGESLVAVTGPSGSGKSSLVAAGLVPRLRRTGVPVAVLRPDPEPPGPEQLAAAVLALTDPGSDSARRGRDARRLGALLTTPDGRADGVDELAQTLAGRPRTVLVLDQFEEQVETAPRQARLLLELIAALTATPESSELCVVLTLRAAALEQLLTAELAAGVAVVPIGPLDRTRLREVITRPAREAPGLEFDDGLVDRILDEVPDGPTQLPLVESLLARLWQERVGGRLTLAAYTAAGGVAGALADQAERAVGDTVVRPDHERHLNNLLGRLVGVDPDGRASRRRVPYVDLPDGVRGLVPVLAAHRIVVLHGHGERSTVELAHASLAAQWPRLRALVERDEAFLRWRTELSVARARWEGARDDGALLRGTALTASDAWRDRAGEVAVQDREFLARSHGRRRRDRRRLRIGVAALVIALLAASTLAVVVARGRAQLSTQQLAAAARTLAQDATAQASVDPVFAAELALAAYRADPGSVEAQTALATQYVALADADGPPVLDLGDGGALESIDVQGAGPATVLVAVGGDPEARTITLVRDPLGPRPERRDLSRDGTYIDVTFDARSGLAALQRSDGGLDLLDTGRADAVARQVSPSGQYAHSAKFSFDSDRLTWLTGTAPQAVWHVLDLATGHVDQHSFLGARAVGPVADPTHALVVTDGVDQVTLRQTADDRVLQTFPRDSVFWGQQATYCTAAGIDATLHLDDFGTGAHREVPLGPGGSCYGYWLVEGEWLLTQDTTSDGATQWRAVSVSDGSAYWFAAPTGVKVDNDLHNPDSLAIVSSPSGPVPLVAVGRQVVRLHASPDPLPSTTVVVWPTFTEPSDDGRWLVVADGRDVRVVPRNGGPAVATARGLVAGVAGEAFGPDLFLLRIGPDGVRRLAVHAVPDLSKATDVALGGGRAPPGDTSPTFFTTNPEGRVAGVVALIDDTVWLSDAATGRPLAPPFSIAAHTDPVEWYPDTSAIYVRRGHPDQVLVHTPNGHLALWDLPAERRLLDLTPPSLITAVHPVIADGDRLVLATKDGTLQLWDAADGLLTATMPLTGIDDLLGFTPDGRLVVQTHDDLTDRLVLVDVAARRVTASMPSAGFTWDSRIAGENLLVSGSVNSPARTVPLDPAGWRDQLCRVVPPRPSPALLARLPAGVASGPTCGG